MDNIFPKDTIHNEDPSVWAENPKLKTLLLVLMVVFLLSGVGLVVFGRWQAGMRERIYEQSQANLPKHEAKQEAVNEAVNNCVNLPQDIAANKTFAEWSNKNGISETGFCGQEIQPLKVVSTTGFRSQKDCQRVIKDSKGAGQYISSADENRGICMGSFGEPDSYVYLSNLESSALLKTCGTPCSFETGFWIDEQNFVLLEKDDTQGNGEDFDFLITSYNFKENTLQTWKASTVWKKYINEEFNFEFEYPQNWIINTCGSHIDNNIVYINPSDPEPCGKEVNSTVIIKATNSDSRQTSYGTMYNYLLTTNRINGKDSENYNESDIQVSGLTAKKFVWGGKTYSTYESVFFNFNKRTYEILLANSAAFGNNPDLIEKDKEDSQNFDHVLETFKFTK